MEGIHQQAGQVLYYRAVIGSTWVGPGGWEEVVGRKTKLSDALDFESISLIIPFLNKETWTQ